MVFFEISAFVKNSDHLPCSIFCVNGKDYEDVKNKAIKTALFAYPEQDIRFDVYYRAKVGNNDFRTLKIWFNRKFI